MKRAAEIMNEFGKGHLSKRMNIDWKDEIGSMSMAMDSFANTLQKFVKAMGMVSNGDLSIRAEVLDEKDEIAPALNLIITTLNNVKAETDMLTKAALDGELDKRGDLNKFNGGYREIVDGFNQTIKAIVTPIRQAEEVMQTLSTGDLTARLDGQFKGNYQRLQSYVNNLGDSLSDLIKEVQEAIAATASASTQISSSSEEMAAGAQEQSAQTVEIAGAVEEMTKTILETAQNAGQASADAKNAGKIAQEGGIVVQNTVIGMNKIAEVVSKASQTVKELGRSSDQIGEIIQVIDDIADQTNLLALNAAIEAARAGEQGRGFAVVADEVRKLAERTTKATKEIAGMIKQIQKDTVEAVTSIDVGTEEVQKGKELADKAGNSLKEIITGSNKVIDMINQVAAASEEQSSAAEQIGKNIEGISSVTQQSAAGTQQIARAAEDLNRLTENLQDLISRFKINGSNTGSEFSRKVNTGKKFSTSSKTSAILN